MKKRERLKANASNSGATALKNSVWIGEINSVKKEQRDPPRVCHDRYYNPGAAICERVAAAKRVVVLKDQLVSAREIFSDPCSGEAKLTCDGRRVP
jgi:hypothetical protein